MPVPWKGNIVVLFNTLLCLLDAFLDWPNIMLQE